MRPRLRPPRPCTSGSAQISLGWLRLKTLLEQGWLRVGWGEWGVTLLLYSFSPELPDLTAAWGPAEPQGRKVWTTSCPKSEWTGDEGIRVDHRVGRSQGSCAPVAVSPPALVTALQFYLGLAPLS